MTFEEWFDGFENYSMRCERFYDDLADYQGDNAEIVIKWLKAAYEVGYDHAMSKLVDDGK